MYYHWQSIHYLVQFELFRFTISNIILVQFFIVNAISTDIFWLWMIVIDCVCSAIVIAFSLIFFISMKQTNALLTKDKSKFKMTIFDRFKRNHTLILTQVFSSNLFCGYVLTAYLACIIPINTLTVIGLFTGQFSNFVAQFFHINLTIFAFVGLFLIHLMGACFSATIHKCAKYLLNFSVNAPNLSIQQQIKLVLYCEKFLTHENYGLTYGHSHSVMSLQSFSKVGDQFLITCFLIPDIFYSLF